MTQHTNLWERELERRNAEDLQAFQDLRSFRSDTLAPTETAEQYQDRTGDPFVVVGALEYHEEADILATVTPESIREAFNVILDEGLDALDALTDDQIEAAWCEHCIGDEDSGHDPDSTACR